MDTKEAILSTISELGIEDTTNEQDISIDIQEEAKNDFNDEILTLLRLKERSLVLFEGLRNTKDSTLEIKLEMVLNYLEYQLYIIEDRLKAIQDNKQDKAK